MVSSAAAGAAVAAAVCLAASPYLAGLTLTVPDRLNDRWWRGARAGRRRRWLAALAAVVVGGLAGAASGLSALLPAFLSLALAGAPLTLIDWEHHRLPNRLVFAAAAGAAALMGLAAGVRHEWHDYLRAAEGAAAVYLVLFVLMVVSPRSFGWGDVKLGGLLGGYLGYRSWPAVYYGIFAGFLLGSLVGVGLLLARRATVRSPMAFGPMLLGGALVVLAFELPSSLVR